MNECPKAAFASERAAKNGAGAVGRKRGNGGQRLLAYFCPDCHYWHLTSEPIRDRRRGSRRRRR